MSRPFALIAAALLSALPLSSACTAGASNDLRFTVEPQRDGQLKASFHRGGRGSNQWSSSFRAADLAGLDVARLASADRHPVRFAIALQAGRLDCAGTAVRHSATGSCSFAVDPGFASLLAQNHVRRPTEDEAMAMMALDVRRDLVAAIGAARYPAATPGDLVALSALGVTSAYINDLARTGYRPRNLSDLTQFAALKITPDYIQRFARAGYRDIPADQLVQLRALDISPDMVAAFERVGYRPLPVDDLVQFKALGITPAFVESFRRLGYPHLKAETLVELKALNVTPDFVRSVMGRDGALPSPDRLVELRALGFIPRVAADLPFVQGISR
jgi:hypothetical protein